MILPPEAVLLLAALAPAFTQPTCRRFSTLLVAIVLTTGRRTVANLLRTLGGLAPGHRTDYQRVLTRAPWSALGDRLGPGRDRRREYHGQVGRLDVPRLERVGRIRDRGIGEFPGT